MTLGIWAVGAVWAMLGGLGPEAVAQDFDELDDFEFDEPVEESDDESEKGEDEEPKPETVDPPPIDEDDTEVLDLEFEDPAEDEVDLLEGDPEEIEGDDDTEAIYRETLSRIEDLPPDAAIEELQAYLAEYPETVYRSDIQERIDQLFDELYSSGRQPSGTDEDGPVDALRQEIDFSQGLLLDNINPRSRFQAAFAFGAPNYLDATVDYEHAFTRRTSLHGGLRGRFGNFGVEFGPRFALVKSAKAQALVTLSIDGRVGLNPLYPSIRPVLGVGKKFGSVQIQAQAGADLEIRDVDGTTLQTRYTGGAQLQWNANESVAVFAETQLLFKPQPLDGAFQGGLFSFSVVSIGLTFYPQISSDRPDDRPLEAKVGGALPVASQYYGFYLASLNGQVNYFTQ